MSTKSEDLQQIIVTNRITMNDLYSFVERLLHKGSFNLLDSFILYCLDDMKFDKMIELIESTLTLDVNNEWVTKNETQEDAIIAILVKYLLDDPKVLVNEDLDIINHLIKYNAEFLGRILNKFIHELNYDAKEYCKEYKFAATWLMYYKFKTTDINDIKKFSNEIFEKLKLYYVFDGSEKEKVILYNNFISGIWKRNFKNIVGVI